MDSGSREHRPSNVGFGLTYCLPIIVACLSAKPGALLLLENPEEVRPMIEDVIQLPSSEIDYLLFDWLNELLFRFESQGLLFAEFTIRIDDQGLQATMRGEQCDRTRHRMAHEVKAITYHGLCVEQTESGWQTELILDI